MARFEIAEGWTAQAYRFALDPTPTQLRALASHAGAARFAHNHMLALVKAVMDQRGAERSYGIDEAQLTPGGVVVAGAAHARLRALQRRVAAPHRGRRSGGGTPRPASAAPTPMPPRCAATCSTRRRPPRPAARRCGGGDAQCGGYTRRRRGPQTRPQSCAGRCRPR
ncbi:MAG TPA: helix-turn-helix domain-containing protein [Mycobacterium sp.]|nr:helix-turn-helix domain-containing protein [Mycobacterium sp.]